MACLHIGVYTRRCYMFRVPKGMLLPACIHMFKRKCYKYLFQFAKQSSLC